MFSRRCNITKKSIILILSHSRESLWGFGVQAYLALYLRLYLLLLLVRKKTELSEIDILLLWKVMRELSCKMDGSRPDIFLVTWRSYYICREIVYSCPCQVDFQLISVEFRCTSWCHLVFRPKLRLSRNIYQLMRTIPEDSLLFLSISIGLSAIEVLWVRNCCKDGMILWSNLLKDCFSWVCHKFIQASNKLRQVWCYWFLSHLFQVLGPSEDSLRLQRCFLEEDWWIQQEHKVWKDLFDNFLSLSSTKVAYAYSFSCHQGHFLTFWE